MAMTCERGIPRRDQDSFLHGPRSQAYCKNKKCSGEYGQLLELGVAQRSPEDFNQVDSAHTITDKMANGDHSTGLKTSAPRPHWSDS